MDKHTIKRDGLPPLAFTGEIIATADNKIGTDGNHANRWTRVRIYRTKAGKFVASVTRFTQWQGESDHYEAASFATPAEVIEYLKGDNDRLGSVSQEAVEDAAKVEPAFAAVWVEEVE